MQQGFCLAEIAFIPTTWVPNFIVGKKNQDGG